MSTVKLTETQLSALQSLVDVPGRGWVMTSASAWYRLSEEESSSLEASPLVELGFSRSGCSRVRITAAGRAALKDGAL